MINPGTLHYIDFSNNPNIEKNDYVSNSKALETGICALMNSRASSLDHINHIDGSAVRCLRSMVKQWDKKKIVEFSNRMNRIIYDTKDKRKSVRSGRVKNTIKLLRKFNQKYGVLKTANYGFDILAHYGIKLTISKFKSRID